MMDRKCTRHNWCALRKFRKSSKVDLPLPDLHDLLLTLALVILIRILPLGRFLVSGAISGEVHRTSASKPICLMENFSMGPWELHSAPNNTLVAAHQRVQSVPSSSSQHDAL